MKSTVLGLQNHEKVAGTFETEHAILRGQVPPLCSNLANEDRATRAVGRLMATELIFLQAIIV